MLPAPRGGSLCGWCTSCRCVCCVAQVGLLGLRQECTALAEYLKKLLLCLIAAFTVVITGGSR